MNPIRDKIGERLKLNNKEFENARCAYEFDDGFTALMCNGTIDEWRCLMVKDGFEYTTWNQDVDILAQGQKYERKYPGIMKKILKAVIEEIPERPKDVTDYIRYEQIFEKTLDKFKVVADELKTEYKNSQREPFHRFIGWLWMFCIAEQNRLIDEYTVTEIGANMLITGLYRACYEKISPLEVMIEANIFNKKYKYAKMIKDNFRNGLMDNEFFTYDDWTSFKDRVGGRGASWLNKCYKEYAKKKGIEWLYVN